MQPTFLPAIINAFIKILIVEENKTFTFLTLLKGCLIQTKLTTIKTMIGIFSTEQIDIFSTETKILHLEWFQRRQGGGGGGKRGPSLESIDDLVPEPYRRVKLKRLKSLWQQQIQTKKTYSEQQ